VQVRVLSRRPIFRAVKVKILRSNPNPVPGANHGCENERRLSTQVYDRKGSRELRLCFFRKAAGGAQVILTREPSFFDDRHHAIIVTSGAVRIQLLRLERLQSLEQALVQSQPAFHEARSSVKQHWVRFSPPVIFEGSESAVTSTTHPKQMHWFKSSNPRPVFSLVSIFAGSESSVTSKMLVGGSSPPVPWHVAQRVEQHRSRDRFPRAVFSRKLQRIPASPG
jgi:hypothetical protein